jgi:hypothetical protein
MDGAFNDPSKDVAAFPVDFIWVCVCMHAHLPILSLVPSVPLPHLSFAAHSPLPYLSEKQCSACSVCFSCACLLRHMAKHVEPDLR